ncbi:ribonuclease H-like domain-containing protein [Tanacetum coccineum]|uniref:Ribonuclease H-like domain-containing protein n=1 Tax=Tanacetum coccineum TaxID=301880 RepID=A0ABQ5HYW3_9ASTR
MTAPSTSSTNDVNTALPAYEVSTVSPNIKQLLCPQLDLEKIHEDDLEAMDLKWQLSPLSMRAKRYFQRIGKKIFINANDTAGYDKSKVECFNCHKMGHFARECRAPRNKKGQFKYQDNTRKQGNNEDTSSKAMLVIDGVVDASRSVKQALKLIEPFGFQSKAIIDNKENLMYVEDGLDNENDEKDKYEDDSSPKEVNTAGQHVNTVSPKVNTGHFKHNIVDPSVNTASLYDQDSPKDMFTLEASHTLEATHVEFFSDEDEPEVDLGNIINSYTAPTTPNIRIHKDHPIENVISDVKSTVQTRRMTKPTSKQGLLSVVYEQKTHDTMILIYMLVSYHRLNPQALLKLYLIHLRWK